MGNVQERLANWVLLEARPAADPDGDELLRVDRATGRRKVLATRIFDPGDIHAAAVVGRWLVYCDQRGAITNGDVPCLWRVFALNLRTRQKLLLNGDKPD